MAITIQAVKRKDRNTVETSEWPSPTNTGAAASGLTPVGSGVTLSTNGLIYQNMAVAGTITISGDNVTVRNCRVSITGAASYGIIVTGQNALIEDVTIETTADGPVGLASTAGGWFIGRRLNVTGMGDGVRCDSSQLYDSYVTVGATVGPHHDTVMGYGTGWVIEHNTILNDGDETSCASLAWDGETVSNGILRNNFLAGGGFTIYGGLGAIQVLDNKFSILYYPNCGSYDYLYPNNKPATWSGNVWIDGPNIGQAVVK